MCMRFLPRQHSQSDIEHLSQVGIWAATTEASVWKMLEKVFCVQF